MFDNGLWVIALEMGCAIGLAVFIVWWTWPRKPKRPAEGKSGGQEQKGRAEP